MTVVAIRVRESGRKRKCIRFRALRRPRASVSYLAPSCASLKAIRVSASPYQRRQSQRGRGEQRVGELPSTADPSEHLTTTMERLPVTIIERIFEEVDFWGEQPKSVLQLGLVRRIWVDPSRRVGLRHHTWSPWQSTRARTDLYARMLVERPAHAAWIREVYIGLGEDEDQPTAVILDSLLLTLGLFAVGLRTLKFDVGTVTPPALSGGAIAAIARRSLTHFRLEFEQYDEEGELLELLAEINEEYIGPGSLLDSVLAGPSGDTLKELHVTLRDYSPCSRWTSRRLSALRYLSVGSERAPTPLLAHIVAPQCQRLDIDLDGLAAIADQLPEFVCQLHHLQLYSSGGTRFAGLSACQSLQTLHTDHAPAVMVLRAMLKSVKHVSIACMDLDAECEDVIRWLEGAQRIGQLKRIDIELRVDERSQWQKTWSRRFDAACARHQIKGSVF